MLLSGLLLFVLVARLFQIQVISSGGYLRLSRDNQFRQIRVAAPRGLILDRNGSVLAKNVAACEASVSARSLEQRPETLPRLVDVGVRGIAVSHAVCAAADPGAVVARLLGLMGPSAAAP